MYLNNTLEHQLKQNRFLQAHKNISHTNVCKYGLYYYFRALKDKQENILPYFFSYKTEFFSIQNNPKKSRSIV